MPKKLSVSIQLDGEGQRIFTTLDVLNTDWIILILRLDEEWFMFLKTQKTIFFPSARI